MTSEVKQFYHMVIQTFFSLYERKLKIHEIMGDEIMCEHFATTAIIECLLAIDICFMSGARLRIPC